MNIDHLITVKENFLVILDSRNAVQYYNGSFNSNVYFEFDEPLRIPKDAIKCYASLLSFSSPNSIYTINENNSLLSMTVGATNHDYIVPYGNYNANTFMKTLKAVIDSGFTITFNTITNIFTLAHSTQSFSINPSSTIYEVMGFSKNTTYNSTGRSLTLPFTCNFNGLSSINVHLANVTNSNIDSYNRSTSSIIQSIPIETGSGQIFYDKSNDYNYVVNADHVDYIEIRIQDDMENFINFNNQHWNMTLYFTVVKDVERFSHHNSFFTILQNGYT
jgi:hypothetical protein